MTITELIESVRRIEVRTNRLVNDTMVGAYLSHFKGRGMDFEELREYMPGDEVRDIDWNVTYRMGRPFVKRYREERELAMVLAVDVSASSAFGSLRRTKREFAAEIAGTLAMSASRSSDKVALLLFSDQVELYLPPRKGRRHILRLIREMLHFEPKHRGTNIPAALAFVNHVLNRRSILFLITDFLHSFGQSTGSSPRSAVHGPQSAVHSPQSAVHGPRAAVHGPQSTSHGLQSTVHSPADRDVIQEIGLTNAHHDVVCVHLHDPRESELPAAGLLTIEDAETSELLEVDSSRAAVRDKFARTNAERLAELDRALRRAGVDTLSFSTAGSFAQVLQAFFETRRGRRRG